MALFQLTIKLSDSGASPILVVEARYKDRFAYSIPKKIDGIEEYIQRLEADILRDAATRRGDQPTSVDFDAGSFLRQNKRDTLGISAEQLGTLLFNYLFSDNIEKLYRDAETDIDIEDQSLQVTLSFSDNEKEDPLPSAPWLNLTPWETLWDRKSRVFLATAGSLFFSRALGTELNPKPRQEPLRVLIMRAAPQVFRGKQLGDLKGPIEVAKIKEVVSSEKCEVQIVPGESLDELEEVLFENSSEPKHFDVFHFIGHGDFDPIKREGYLLFREADGAGGEPIYASYLRQILTDPWGPQLVVLNSCSGAESAAGDMFSSTAALLSLGKIPAVVAMQFPISDAAAIAFSGSFYRWIGKGARVQDAIRRARWSLARFGPEWITPVLYLRNSTGALVTSYSEQ